MEWYKRMVSPVKNQQHRPLISSSSSSSRKDGILQLKDEVQSCGYSDIQIMWELVRRSEEIDERRRYNSLSSCSSPSTNKRNNYNYKYQCSSSSSSSSVHDDHGHGQQYDF